MAELNNAPEPMPTAYLEVDPVKIWLSWLNSGSLQPPSSRWYAAACPTLRSIG